MESRRLLVVDDELLIRDLLYDHFTAKNYQITTAQSAEDALEIINSNVSFDVVLTDLKMPGMGGLELIEQLKQSVGDIPVIIMTGFPSLDTAIEALHQRVFDYVIKPFNINRLNAVVEAAIEEHETRHQTTES
ncbi:MAG: response regulator [bacterium]